jgi:hypothetical protein
MAEHSPVAREQPHADQAFLRDGPDRSPAVPAGRGRGI